MSADKIAAAVKALEKERDALRAERDRLQAHNDALRRLVDDLAAAASPHMTISGRAKVRTAMREAAL